MTCLAEEMRMINATSRCFSRNLPGFTLLGVLLCFQTVFAQVPTTINYQGYLTDDMGAPLNTGLDATFNLYNVAVGGAPLWTSDYFINIADGKFDIELGVPDPFPVGLFDQPLFLGIEIDGDGEMVPRKAISVVPYAFRAVDADTLQGMTAVSLDQSSHVADVANPHAVTAIQAGAPSSTAFNNHTSFGSAHHTRYGDGEAVLAMGITGNFNPLNHSRYSNAEALATMGAIADTNPLNHTKYTDSEAVAALLNADGAGSTLDADLLDGQEASEIIDAAGGEFRTPVSSLPFTISTSGSYFMDGNLTFNILTEDAITVNANNVTIDLMGFTLAGPGKTSGGMDGIDLSGNNNVTVINGTVRNFGGDGIKQDSATNHSTRILNMRVLNNGLSGIDIIGNHSYIADSISSNNGSNGFSIGYSFVSGFLEGIGGHINRCIAWGNGLVGFRTGKSSVVNDNVSYNNDTGFELGHGAVVTFNSAYENIRTGFNINKNSSVSYNSSNNNNSAGELLSGGDGFSILAGSTAAFNTASENFLNGISAEGASLIYFNTITSNNIADSTGRGGISTGTSSRVAQNLVRNNSMNGIVVNNGKTIVENNHVIGSAIGINFTSLDNGRRDNSFSDNTVDVDGSAHANGGGAFSF